MTETQNSESAEDTDKLTVFTPFCVCFPCHTQHKHVFVFLSHTTQTCVFVSLSHTAQTCVFIFPVTAQTCFCFPFHIQHKRVFLFFLSHTTQTCVCFPFTRNTNICFYFPYHTQHKHGDVFVSLCIFDFPFTHSTATADSWHKPVNPPFTYSFSLSRSASEIYSGGSG